MNMIRFPGLPCLAAGLVILLCFCAACTSGPSGQTVVNTTPVPGGITALEGNYSSLHMTYTLDDAESAVLQVYQTQTGVNAQNESIFYIRGDQVDSSGKAERWIFGISQGNISSMMVYDSKGVSTLAMPPGLPAPENIPSPILSPEDIMKIASSSSGAGLLNLNGSSLELMNGQYTVTGSGSGQKGIVINAPTGELIAPQD